MSSLLVLVGCAVIPWTVCRTLGGLLIDPSIESSWARRRALERYRRVTLTLSVSGLVGASVAGSLCADVSELPVAGAWFLSSLSLVVAAISFSLCRTRALPEAPPFWEVVRRTIRLCAVAFLPAGLCLAAWVVLERWVPLSAPGPTVVAALACVWIVAAVNPCLIVLGGVWSSLDRRLETQNKSWRLTQLPIPDPTVTHAAAIPWIRTVLVSDAMAEQIEDDEALVRYEVWTRPHTGRSNVRWFAAMFASALGFVLAGAIGWRNANALVAGMSVATYATIGWTWWANRQPSDRNATLRIGSDGPSLQELASALRRLRLPAGQVFPTTSHQPLDRALYDRLFALGHDPGPRPHP